jgi:Ni/Co efflux regulator RcnB
MAPTGAYGANMNGADSNRSGPSRLDARLRAIRHGRQEVAMRFMNVLLATLALSIVAAPVIASAEEDGHEEHEGWNRLQDWHDWHERQEERREEWREERREHPRYGYDRYGYERPAYGAYYAPPYGYATPYYGAYGYPGGYYNYSPGGAYLSFSIGPR